MVTKFSSASSWGKTILSAIASKQFIYIVFSLVIFVLLVIQLYLLAKQYILPFLRRQIAILNQLWVDLQKKTELLSSTKKRLEKQIDEQEVVLSNLEKKIKVWHETMSEKQKNLDAEQEKLFEDIKEKRTKQNDHIQNRNLEKEIVPKAIKEAKEELRKKYASDGKKLLSKVISDLAKAEQ